MRYDSNDGLLSIEPQTEERPYPSEDESPQAIERNSPSDFDASQWTLVGPGAFIPAGKSFRSLPPGFYKPARDPNGRLFAELQPLLSDNLEILPGSCNGDVISSIRKFWASEELYKKYGLSYKRGVLFYGPPGSGKTANIIMICQELITVNNGVVLICQNTRLLIDFVHKLRQIEPTRSLVIVMEDLDEILSHNQRHDVLALLDGELSISNVVFLATTNYPERLDANISNRPSRFDDRILIDMPTDITRRAYLQKVTKLEPLSDYELDLWVSETNGMSISHLRELVVAVRCLGRDYRSTLKRLEAMSIRPESKEGLKNKPMGIGSTRRY